MPDAPPPIVLVMIDKDSRLVLLRHTGVQVAFFDQRAVDPHVLLMPDAHQDLEMFAALQKAGGYEYPVISLSTDDAAHTASVILSRLTNRQIVVASGPREMEQS